MRFEKKKNMYRQHVLVKKVATNRVAHWFPTRPAPGGPRLGYSLSAVRRRLSPSPKVRRINPVIRMENFDGPNCYEKEAEDVLRHHARERVEHWCVEAESAGEAREMLASGEGHRCDIG